MISYETVTRLLLDASSFLIRIFVNPRAHQVFDRAAAARFRSFPLAQFVPVPTDFPSCPIFAHRALSSASLSYIFVCFLQEQPQRPTLLEATSAAAPDLFAPTKNLAPFQKQRHQNV